MGYAKINMDRFSGEPEDGFTNFCEAVDDEFTDGFFEANEEWITNGAGLCNLWMDMLYQEVTPKQAARIIEKVHARFKRIDPSLLQQ
jgi:hypothetical protein